MAKLNNKTLAALGNVAKASKDSAALLQTVYLDDSQLMTYPENKEDISYTEDIEASIERLGFTDPIEVTDFEMEAGTYMIVSGNRRRAAGQKKGLKSFPCIIRHFRSREDIENYALLANNHRDSGKGDPLLLAKRALKHKAYLESISFKGSMRDEIAVRMGITTAQVDRYLYMHKAIPEFWDMVQEGSVGLSSITDSGLYRHTPDEQMEIFKIVQDCMADGNDMTRPVLKKIVVGYRDGVRSWEELKEQEKAPAVNREPDQIPQPPMTLFSPGTDDNVVPEAPKAPDTQQTPESDGDDVGQEESPDNNWENDSQEESPDSEWENNSQEESPDSNWENDGQEESPDSNWKNVGKVDSAAPVENRETARTRKIIGRMVELDDLLTDRYILDEGEEGECSAGNFISRMRNMAELLIQEIQGVSTEYHLEEKGIGAINEILSEIKIAQAELEKE